MCRNITELRGLEPAATAEEIEAAARQYVRKVSGITRPTPPTPRPSRPRSPRSPRPPRGCWRAAAAPAAAQDGAAAAPPRGAGAASRATASEQPALKEWSAAVHAMLDGRQTVLLRKGGIHEKRFDVAAREFVFFPTVAHGHAERVRPEHRDLLDAAAADSTDDEIVIRAGAKVVAAVEVNQPEGLDEIADTAHLDSRVGARRPAGLPAEAPADRAGGAGRPLAEPVRLARTPDYAGCTSWVDLPVDADWGEPVHDDATLAGDRRTGASLSRLTADADPPAAPAATCRPRRGARCASPAPSVLPRDRAARSVPRLRANRGCEPPATSTRIRDPARKRCAIASSSSRTVPESGCDRRRYPSLTLRERPSRVDLADPDEQVVVAGCRTNATAPRPACRRRRDPSAAASPVKVKHVAAFGQSRVVAVTALRGQQPPADRRRRVGGVEGERRRRARPASAGWSPRVGLRVADTARARASPAASRAGPASRAPLT